MTLAPSYRSRASAARVDRALDLIREVLSGRYKRHGPCTSNLSATEYHALRQRVKEDEGLNACFEDKLRFDYSRQKKCFEIRLPTIVQQAAISAIIRVVVLREDKLDEHASQDVLNTVQSILPIGSTRIEFPQARGEPDTMSPDLSFGHGVCELGCASATAVFEVAWTHTQWDLSEAARRYLCSPKSEVRTVVGLNLHEMYLAELRNEKRGYSADEDNETAEATFSIWRASEGWNGKKGIDLVVSDEVFRDTDGSAIPSAAIRLCLADFICQGELERCKGAFTEELLITSEVLCRRINNGLGRYRVDKRNKMENREETESLISDGDETRASTPA